MLRAVNRDRDQITEPDNFCGPREEKRQASSGSGVNLCPGAALACVKMSTLFTVLRCEFTQIRSLATKLESSNSFPAPEIDRSSTA